MGSGQRAGGEDVTTGLEKEEGSNNRREGLEAEQPAEEQSGWIPAISREANPPLQFAELHEDLIALVFHLPMNAHYLHTLHQGLQSLSVVFHTGTGAGREDGALIPCQGNKIPHAVGQLSPCATVREACLPQLRKAMCCNKDPTQPKQKIFKDLCQVTTAGFPTVFQESHRI